MAMHPLVAISLVFLTGLAWTGTVLTLLVSLTRARRRRAGTARTVQKPGTGSGLAKSDS